MGRLLQLDETVTDSSLPILPVALNAGSLLLMDANYDRVDISGFKSGLAALSTGTYDIPLVNRAVGQAASLGITGAGMSLQANGGTTVDLAENTLRGGLHIRVTGQGTTTETPARLGMNSALVTYLNANKGHVIFGSIWGWCTKTGAALNYFGKVGVSTSNAFFSIPTTGSIFSNGGGERNGSVSALGSINAMAAGSFVGTGSVSGITVSWKVSGVGTDLPGMIIYRVYLEDLTVSGQTYAQAKSIDDQLRALAFGTGGRLASDTWTTPV